MAYQQKDIPVSKLVLDPNNPRFFELRELRGKKALTEKDLIDEMSRDDQIPTLTKSIKRSGVKDPLWVKQTSNGKFLVIEGNRRTYILRKLIEENVQPPGNTDYHKVKANVLPIDTKEPEVLLQRVRLQAGKKDWGHFNEAVTTYDLKYKYGMQIEDIATELQISVREGRERLENYARFMRFVKETDTRDPKKFAFFTDMPKPVKDWINENESNEKMFFNLITPKDGVQKIRSVATRGGLRDFARVLDYPSVVKEFLKDSQMTVEDALEEVKERDVLKDAPFLTKIGRLAGSLAALSDEQIEKLRSERKIVSAIKHLKRVCDSVLKKLETK